MSVIETAPDIAVAFHPPAGVSARGTVVVLPGRGEHGGVYERFGRRLAADGYRVHALEWAPSTAADAYAVVAAVFGGAKEPPRPWVVAGSDTGAVLALAAAGPVGADAAIIAGYPVSVGFAADSVDDEIEARTSCPVHAGRLRHDPRFTAAALDAPVPDGVPLGSVAVPVLALHGEADAVSPYPAARTALSTIPDVVLVTLAGGRHDAFNDRSHRTAAAHVVLFLEDLRAGAAVAASERPG